MTDRPGTNRGPRRVGGPRPAREARETPRLPWAPVLGLLAIGLLAAAQLALVQLGVLAAWDPLFGDGTTRVLTSAPARAIPVPDAALGAAAYALEIALLLGGGAAHPGRSLALALLATAMGLGGIVLLGLQALVVGAFCVLCLVSAFASIVVALAELPVVVPLAREVRARRSEADPSSQAHRTHTAPPR